MNEGIPLYYINPKDGTELVLIPGGWYWMGAREDDQEAGSDEKPRHLHYVELFYLGIACITVAQFQKFVKETGHDPGEEWKEDPAEHPVRYVNWNDAKAYCRWANLRLPTEAEWELGARGYESLKYPWGNEWVEGRRVCWDRQRGPKGETAPVFAHPEGVSVFGTYQQSGNVWEWCEDGGESGIYRRYPQNDFIVPDKGEYRVVRGGSWRSSNQGYFRGSDRLDYDPGLRSWYACRGFRAARTVTF